MVPTAAPHPNRQQTESTHVQHSSSARPDVGGAITLLRERKGLSQRALSARACRSVSYISKVEAGFCRPSFRGFSQIAVALGMNPMEIWALVHLEAGRPDRSTQVETT